jgi:hypothetical protein
MNSYTMKVQYFIIFMCVQKITSFILLLSFKIFIIKEWKNESMKMKGFGVWTLH